MRSAWIKWARAVEHQRVLARHTREFSAIDSYEYARWDNAGDATDPLLKVHWRLKIKQPYPEQWSVLLGDILTNLRAALDHTFWAATVTHSGPPAKPNRIQFPIATDADKFEQAAKELRPLVHPDIWTLIEALQPFHGADKAHTAPLEVLRWLSNVDKHRFVHVVGRTSFDFGPVIVRSETPLEVVDEWRHEGPADDNTVVVRLKLKRPLGSSPIDLIPTFAHMPTLQISDNPAEFRTLASAMNVMRDEVLKVVTFSTDILGLPIPDPDSLELGHEHEDIAAEYGGNIATLREHDGTVQRFALPTDKSSQQCP